VKADWENNVVMDNLKEIVSLCNSYSIQIGTIARTYKEIKLLASSGVNYIVYQNDVAILKESLLQLKSNI
tara:strand:+ start:204 stop:413 length:210 start_codon:yes stop_codon:yes gene_type:complete